MEPNTIFYIDSAEKYNAFISELSHFFSITECKPTHKSMTSRHEISKENSKIFLTLYGNKLLIQGSPSLPAYDKVIEIASRIFKPQAPIRKPEETDLLSTAKDYFIGLDESGVGETFGSMFLGMAFITKENLIKAQQTLIPKDAKIFNIRTILSLNMESKKYFARELKMFRAREIDFSDKIHLLDTGYIELLTKVENDLPNSCVILDDYGIGPELRKFFEIWREKGLIPIIVHGADSKYLPPMAASIIARKARNTEIEKIASDNSVVDPVTKEEIPLTQGSPSNPLTDKWLIAYRRAYPTQEFPSFVRTKWKNVKEIEEKYPRKKLEFSFQCPGCNSKFIKLYLKINSITKSSEVLCPRCGKILEKSFFKRYFTSLTIVIDTSTCISRTLSKDLSTTKYFEGATILLPSCLYEEIDRKSPDKKKGATNEIDYLRHAKENGLIDLREVDTDSLVDLTNDKKIIYVAKSHSASIMTKDTTQSLWSAISTFGFQIIQN